MNREAVTAYSRGRQPMEMGHSEFQSRECGGSNHAVPKLLLSPHSRLSILRSIPVHGLSPTATCWRGLRRFCYPKTYDHGHKYR